MLARAGLGPRDVLRAAEARDRGLEPLDDEALLDAMVADPILIERPLVETAHGIRLCRPPERVHEIL